MVKQYWVAPRSLWSVEEHKQSRKSMVKVVPASDYDALATENAKLIRARTLSAEASATLRDESLAHQTRGRELERLLKLVQSDPGNWLHSDLQAAIVKAVGEDPPYRSVDDSGIGAAGDAPR